MPIYCLLYIYIAKNITTFWAKSMQQSLDVRELREDRTKWQKAQSNSGKKSSPSPSMHLFIDQRKVVQKKKEWEWEREREKSIGNGWIKWPRNFYANFFFQVQRKFHQFVFLNKSSLSLNLYHIHTYTLLLHQFICYYKNDRRKICVGSFDRCMHIIITRKSIRKIQTIDYIVTFDSWWKKNHDTNQIYVKLCILTMRLLPTSCAVQTLQSTWCIYIRIILTMS